MNGARPLSDQEVSLMLSRGFEGRYALRNQILFLLRVKTGLRVSEALSIKVVDILSPDGGIRGSVYISRRNVKGKAGGREIALQSYLREQLRLYLMTLPDTQEYLFTSGKGGRLDKKAVWRIDKMSCARVGIDPYRVSTHSTRKTFAEKIHNLLGNDIIKTQKALGHKDINSTTKYLNVDSQEIVDAMEKV